MLQLEDNLITDLMWTAIAV